MKKVLVVEDNPIVLKVLKKIIGDIGQFSAIYATTMAQAKELADGLSGELFASIVDLNLPDAPDGEVVDLILSKGIPAIVLTGSYSDEKREALFNKGIVDYVVKESVYSYEYAIQLIHRLEKNTSIHVLVVEDSKSSRTYIRKLLEKNLFIVHEAEDGMEAVKKLQLHPQIMLMITDYNMPNMDGFELTSHIRRVMDKKDLIVIGLSAEGNTSLSAKFIKNGANDFLKKPFMPEEFHCRINHSIEEKELLIRIKDSANRDYLTGLYNRRYFYKQANKIISQCQGSTTPISCCIIDIDHFKSFNDTYGHDVGDGVLIHMADVLRSSFSNFICARLGGEEFAAFFPKLNLQQATILVDEVRKIIADTPFPVGGDNLYITFSAGVSELKTDFATMLKVADNGLYSAKDAGRNIVIAGELDQE